MLCLHKKQSVFSDMARLAGTLLLLGIVTALWEGGMCSNNGRLRRSTVAYVSFYFSQPAASAAELVIVPEDSTALEGNTLIVTCVGYGVPAPEMTWLKNGTEIVNGSGVSVFLEDVVVDDLLFVQTTLEICGLNATEDAGTYACRASNDNGTVEHYFQVNVEPTGTVYTS